MRKKICIALMTAFTVLLGVSSYFIIDHYREAEHQEQLYDSLVQLVEDSETEPALPIIYSEDKTILPELTELYRQNNDLVGWICVEDTNINYPVMQTVDNPNYYLKRNFDKEYSDLGTPYIQENCDLKAMSFVEGGSTITQQIAKNQYYTQEKKLERKFAEIFTAIELEKYCSKQEIFELYVNTIYFGSGYYGIYDAAEGYYGKQPSELSDYEAVMLAGLPNAPSAYSLNVNPDLAYSRMETVLSSMVKCGVIEQEQAEDILKNGN